MAAISSANIRQTVVNRTNIALSWDAPASGPTPFSFTVRYRAHGTLDWLSLPTTHATSATITGLSPHTTYDVEVVADD